MKTLFNRLAGRWLAKGSGRLETLVTGRQECLPYAGRRRLESLSTGRQECLPYMAALLLAALPLSAATTTAFTSTGWVTGLLHPGIVCTNAQGQVIVRANIHTARVESTDARLTGNRLIIVHGGYNADGTANLQGTCYQQVGTWDDAKTTFTPTGGLWEISYQGVMGADNSLLLTLVGYGSGGAIDGMRIEESLTRAPCSSPGDPTVPYLYTGTLKSAPVNTTEVLDNFDDNKVTGWTWTGNGTQFPLVESNKQFTVRAKWPGTVTRAHWDTQIWPYVYKNWSVANNQTLECRVDLVSMSENATNAAGLAFWSTTFWGSYTLFKGRDFVEVAKYEGSSFVVFLHDPVVIKNTNVVLSLALTRVHPNVVVTARVLDKDNQEAVLYQRSVVDTPKRDPALTSAELLARSGMKLAVIADSGAPRTSGSGIFLLAFQYTDGKQPELDITYDNLELRTSEVPPVGVERAVRLSWPASATINYAVEGAPTVQGPWLPVQDTLPPGLNQMTVPLSDIMKFFRLQQAP